MDKNLQFSHRGNFCEAAFNYGFLTAITYYTNNKRACEIWNLFKKTYEEGIDGFKFYDYKELIKKYMSRYNDMKPEYLDTLFFTNYMQGYDAAKSYVLGVINFINSSGSSYLSPITSNIKQTENKKLTTKINKVEIIYLQLGLHHIYRDSQAHIDVRNIQAELLSKQLNIDYNIAFSIIDNNMGSGDFTNADTLVLLKRTMANKDEYYLFVSDESSYIKNQIMAIENAEDIVHYCQAIKQNICSQSFFSNVDFTDKSKVDYSKAGKILKKTFDKSLDKATQAGAYTYSLIKVMNESLKNKEIAIFNDASKFKIKRATMCGITNEGLATINYKNPSIDDLKGAYEAYRDHNSDFLSGIIFTENKLGYAINSVFKRQETEKGSKWKAIANRLEGKKIDEVDKEEKLPPNTYIIEENTLKNEHSEKLSEILPDDSYIEIILPGAPGIGKTYAFANTLRLFPSHFSFYVAPRIPVLISCMKEICTQDEKTLVITGSKRIGANCVQVAGNEEAINELSRLVENSKYTMKIIDFENDDKDSEIEETLSSKSDMMVDSISQTEGMFNTKKDEEDEGVMECISNVVRICVEHQKKNPESHLNNIAVIMTTQAYSKCHKKNQEKYLYNMCGLDSNLINLKDKKDFISTYKNVFFIIDEVSGDEAGINIATGLQRIRQALLKDVERFNCKNIIMDASLQDGEILKVYSQKINPEQIYIKSPVNDTNLSIFKREIEYDGDNKGVEVGCNCFPAKAINMIYKYSYKVVKEDDNLIIDYGNGQRRKETLYFTELCNDLEKFKKKQKLIKTKNNTMVKEQCIVFIQNREECERLQRYCEDRLSLKCELINSDISVSARKELLNRINDENNDVNRPDIICVTSSASRGASFKHVTNIFIVVPSWDIAASAMEIIQTIYRGRGDDYIDANEEKTLQFYLDLSKILPREIFKKTNESKDEIKERNRRNSLRKNDIYAIISLLNESITTRICGAGQYTGVSVTPLGRQGNPDLSRNNLYELSKAINKLGEEVKMTEDITSDEFKIYNNAEALAHGITINTKQDLDICYNFDKLVYQQIDGLCDIDILTEKNRPSPLPPFAIVNGCFIARLGEIATNQLRNQLKFSMDEIDKVGFLNRHRNNGYQGCALVLKYIEQIANIFPDSDYQLYDNTEGCYYICIPLPALGKNYNRLDWQLATKVKNLDGEEFNDYEKRKYNIILLLREMISKFVSVNNVLPISCDPGFDKMAYIMFTSPDIEIRLGKRFNRTEVFASNTTNALSLIISAMGDVDSENNTDYIDNSKNNVIEMSPKKTNELTDEELERMFM